MPHIAATQTGANLTPTAWSQSALLPRTERQLNSVQTEESDSAGRWIAFEYCISLIAITLRRQSRPIHIKTGQWVWLRGLPYVGVSLVFGWWGLPWGVIYTPVTVFANLTGGCDITAQVRETGAARN
jgi:hypothetical protein